MAEDVRKQEALHRVQIGLTGLAGILLLVGLANIVIDKARVDDVAPPPVVPTLSDGSVNAAGQPKEPLAELGVAPSADSQVVPDLQPDPNLNKPMDHEPQQ
jgi:hypothetical protein